MHPAIQFSSLDAMCETGGITIIILIVIVVGVLVFQYLLCHGSFNGMENPSTILDNDDDGNQSTIRRFIRRTLEKIFVLPFVPVDLSSYVMWIFMWFFITTIPMAATRYFESRWKHDTLVLQGPLNLISLMFGCKALDQNAVV
jgi:hypothetical protein